MRVVVLLWAASAAAAAVCPSGETWCRHIELAPGTGAAYATEDAALDGLQQYLAPALAANRKEFAGQSGVVRGFGAGSGYAQIWLRDSATVIPMARYLYGRDYFTTWIEEHLLYQADNGELLDWFANMPPSRFRAIRVKEVFREGDVLISGNKNTLESDQEASAVQAACDYARISGDYGWLRKEVAGQQIVRRLERALRFLLERRLSARYGLVTNGMNADWGDVSPVHEDMRAVHIDDRTPIVAGVYTNALFVSAARKLAEAVRRLGEAREAAYWEAQAARIGERMNRHLWMPERGYYRIHLIDDPQKAERRLTEFDNTHILAMGGNALAALYGIADERQAAAIFAAADDRYRDLKAKTISLSLMPPYPKGFFRFAAMKKQNSYQNGGEWDWFGGRFVLAEFEHGAEGLARRHLEEIARRSVASGGLYEWHAPGGTGRGSANYSGNAGVLAAAIFEGLFGIDLRHDGLDVRVRLGNRPGAVRVHEPLTGRYVAYHAHPGPDGGALRIWLDTNVRGGGRLAVLLPEGTRVRWFTSGARPVRFRYVRVGDSRYAEARVAWRAGAATILLEQRSAASVENRGQERARRFVVQPQAH